MTALRNQVQLITYADSLGKDLSELRYVLDTYLTPYIGGVHILPFYPYSEDRGFSPLTHLEVNPVFGTWEDIEAIAARYDLIVDFVANHISAKSAYYQDFLHKGQRSEYADLFLTVAKVFGRSINPEDLAKIYRPRPTDPFQEVRLGDGSTEQVWMSFSADQIDIDWDSPKTQELMRQFLIRLAKAGAKLIRLDAIGYIMKRPGTNSFFVPEVYDQIDWIKDQVKGYSVELLPEVHFHHTLQFEIAKRCDWTYDFALPMLVLLSLYSGNAHRLKHWIQIRPANQITTLDTHDGIGVVDVEDLMSEPEITFTRESILAKGGNEAMRATGAGADNLDVYQVNATYYSALGDDNAYLVARAIQFFVPGIPQVYYVGLLAGRNDLAKFRETNVGRDLNRHDYTLGEIEEELTRPVVQRLLNLMEFRNTYPAFNGEFRLLDSPEHQLIMQWSKDDSWCRLEVDLSLYRAVISYLEDGEDKVFDV